MSKFSACILCCVFLISCQTEQQPIDKTLQYVSEDVAILYTIDSKRFLTKGNFVQATDGEATNRHFEKNTLIHSLLYKPNQIGLSTDAPTFVAQYFRPGKENSLLNCLLVPIKDQSLLTEFIKSARTLTFAKEDNYYKAHMEQGLSLGWNEEVCVITKTNKNADLLIKKTLTSYPDASVNTNRNLAQSLEESSDVSIWMSSEFLAKNESAKLLANVLNLPSAALQNNHIHGKVDFHEGKMESQLSFFINSQLRQDLDLFFKTKPNKSLYKYIPKAGRIAVLSAAIDIQGIKQIGIEKPQIIRPVKQYLKGKGYSIEEIFEVLDGDLFFALYHNEPNTSALFGTKVKDVEKTKNLLQKGVSKGVLKQLSDHTFSIQNNAGQLSPGLDFQLQEGGFSPVLYLKNKFLFIVGNPNQLQLLESSEYSDGKFITPEIQKELAGQIFATEIQPNSIPEFESDAIENVDIIKAKASRKKASVQVFSNPKNENSLRILLDNLFQNASETINKRDTLEREIKE